MMAPFPSTSPHDQASQAGEARVDHALGLMLAEQPEAALQWAAAVVERDPSMASALVITSRLLEQLGRTRAAVDGLLRAVDRAIDAGDLPLATAAIGDLRALGADVAEPLDRVASAFCHGSSRLQDAPPAPVPPVDDFQPLSPFLTGPALASKAAQIVSSASACDEPERAESRLVAPLALFSSLSREALRQLLAAFETVTVPAGHCVVSEGEEGAAAYIVACGELEVSRRVGEGKPPIVPARLGPGSFFGEMELLSEMPRSASLTATRPSILLVAKRDALDAVAAQRPEVAAELAAHCRRRILANLGRGSPLLNDVPPQVRARLLERFETRNFRKGEKLVREGEEPQGLHLVVSGEVVVVAHEAGEPVLLATLAAGETVGEVELILCRTANADAIAAHPTATLFLPRREFFSLVQDHPALLPGMYMAAVRRHAETRLAIEAACVLVTDGYVLDDSAAHPPESVQDSTTGTARREAAARIPGEDAIAAEMAAQIESTEFPVRITQRPRSVAVPRTSTVPRASTVPPSRSTSMLPSVPSVLPRIPTSWLATGAAVLAAAAVVAIAVLSNHGRVNDASSAATGAAIASAPAAETAPPAVEPVPTPAVPGPLPAAPAVSTARTSPHAAMSRPAHVATNARPAVTGVAGSAPRSAASVATPSPAASESPDIAPPATAAPARPKVAAGAGTSPTGEDFGGRN